MACARSVHRSRAAPQLHKEAEEAKKKARSALLLWQRHAGVDVAAPRSAWTKRQLKCTKSSSLRSMAAARSLAPRRLCEAASLSRVRGPRPSLHVRASA